MESGKQFDECENREIAWLNLCTKLVKRIFDEFKQNNFELGRKYQHPNDEYYWESARYRLRRRCGALRCAYPTETKDKDWMDMDNFYKNLPLRKVISDLSSLEKQFTTANSESEKLNGLHNLSLYKEGDYDKKLNECLIFCRKNLSKYNWEWIELDCKSFLHGEYKAVLAMVFANNPEKIVGITNVEFLKSIKEDVASLYNHEKRYRDWKAEHPVNQKPDYSPQPKRVVKHCEYYEEYFGHKKPWNELEAKFNEANNFLASPNEDNIYWKWQNKIKEKCILCNEMSNSMEFTSLQKKN